MAALRRPRFFASGVVLLTVAVLLYAALQLTLGPPPAAIHVMWTPGVGDADRQTLERRYNLAEGEHLEDRSWAYMLGDTSRANVEALVRDPAVADTAEIDRANFSVNAAATEGRYPSAPRPMLSMVLWALSWIFAASGCSVVALGVVERVAPGSIQRRCGAALGRDASFGRAHLFALLVLVGVLVVLEMTSMRHLTLTYDEPEHLKYGQNILIRHNPARLDDSSMPILALNAVPSAVSMHMPRGPLASLLARPESGRYMTIVFSLMVAICVFAWARELYGPTAGLLALALYTFDANLLAHSQLMTTDVYVAGTIAATLYSFWRFLRVPSWPRLTATGIALGLAELSKYTAVVLYPLLAAIALAYHGREISGEVRARQFGALWSRVVRLGGYGAALALVSALVINVGFLFNRTFTPLDGYSFESSMFRWIQSSAGVLGRMPLLLPYPYVQGLDQVLQHERTGAVFGRIYLLGQLREGEGFPGYYFYASLYKLPLGTLAVVLATAVGFVVRRRRFDWLKNEAVLLLPMLFFAIYFNFFYRAQIGIRHFLIVFPLLYVCCGALMAHAKSAMAPAAIALGIAVAGAMASVLSYYPHFLPYFNELMWDRKQAYTVLADSNIDWGQEEWYLRQYLAAHPEAIVEPPRPVPGTIVVHVNALTGVIGDSDRFRWLRDHFVPVDHVAHAVLVYRVTASDLTRLETSDVF